MGVIIKKNNFAFEIFLLIAPVLLTVRVSRVKSVVALQVPLISWTWVKSLGESVYSSGAECKEL